MVNLAHQKARVKHPVPLPHFFPWSFCFLSLSYLPGKKVTVPQEAHQEP